MPGSHYQNQSRVGNRRVGDYPGLPGREEEDRGNRSKKGMMLVFEEIKQPNQERKEAHRALDGLPSSFP